MGIGDGMSAKQAKEMCPYGPMIEGFQSYLNERDKINALQMNHVADKLQAFTHVMESIDNFMFRGTPDQPAFVERMKALEQNMIEVRSWQKRAVKVLGLTILLALSYIAGDNFKVIELITKFL